MKPPLIALIVACLSLSACSNKPTSADATATGSAAAAGSLAAQLSRSADHGTLASALNDTGLGGIFAGRDSYTLLAPNDRAFATLGSEAAALKGEDGKAATASLLRDHILPGTVTPKDIEVAITRAKDGKVKMRTMGQGEVQFTQSGSAILATASDGTSARIIGEPMASGNSVAIPIDGLLKKH